jgi:hypothetical protein
MLKRRKMLMTSCGAVGFLVLAAAAGAWGLTPSRLTYLTFSGPVGLPGMTLPAGTYAFELAAPDTSLEIVRVRDKEHSKKVYFMDFTGMVERPADLPKDYHVSFGEAPAGAAPPIVVWYPVGDPSGRRFIYNRVR